MKRRWLYIGILFAIILQTVFDGLWNELVSINQFRELQSVMRQSPQFLFTLIGQLFFACIIGFFYLHVPDSKRSIKAGLTIGTILGLLIGVYHCFDLLAAFNVSVITITLEVLKTILLGSLCGFAISLSELKTNSYRNQERAK